MKKITSLMIAVLISYGLSAQLTNYYNRMNHIFGSIDKTKVSTGYLKEFGIRLNEIEKFNGSLSNTNWMDESQWKSIYSSLYSMRVGSAASGMSPPSSVYANIQTQKSNNPDVILLSAQYYSYQQYKTNAVSNGDVTISNEKIYDVSGRNPYDTKKVFAVFPSEYNLEGNTFSFKLQSNMIYTNTNKTLSSVQVDFGNGQGYQIITLNSTINITYSSGGEKELKIKFAYSGGPTIYSHSKLFVDYRTGGSMLRYDGAGLLWNREPITGTNWNGSASTGLVTVELAAGHTSLVKPVRPSIWSPQFPF